MERLRYLNRKSSRLVAGAATVAAFALPASAQAANNCPKPTKPTEASKKLLEREQRTSQRMTVLAKKILRGPLANKGGVSFSEDTHGVRYGELGVTVTGAPDEATGQSGTYNFTVKAPTNKNDNLKLNCVQSIGIRESVPKGTLQSLDFFRDITTGSRTFYAGYSNKYASTSVYTAVTPEHPRGAHLTPARLDAAIEQAEEIIERADLKAPVEAEPPVFKLPEGTWMPSPK